MNQLIVAFHQDNTHDDLFWNESFPLLYTVD